MPLTISTLQDELEKLFDVDNDGFVGWPATVADAAVNWANAYNVYALHALDVSNDVVAITNLAGFISTLTAQMAGSLTSAQAALAFDTAFIAYWTGALFTVGIPPPFGIGGNGIFGLEILSIVTAITPGVLQSLLTPIFSVPLEDPSAAALNIATAFHTATTSAVIVTISGTDTTPSGPLPIFNIGPIH